MRIYPAAVVRALMRLIHEHRIETFGLFDDDRGGLLFVDMTGCLENRRQPGAGRVWDVDMAGHLRRVSDTELAATADMVSAWCPPEVVRRGDVG